MSWKKKLAAICVGVPILLVIALIVVVSTYDFNSLKPRIESAVQESTGRTLTMAGDIELDIGFSPALVVQQVALENAEWGSKPEMVTCERFELQVALLPLITGDIRIKRLVLDRPTMLVEKSQQGRFNYEFDTGAKKKEKEKEVAGKEEEPAADRALPGLEVNEVRIDEAELVYRDHAADTGFTARLDRMRASAESMSSPLDFDLEGAFKDIPYALSGEIGSLQSLMQGREMPFRLQADLAGAEAVIEGKRTASEGKNGLTAQVDVQVDSLREMNELAGTDLPRDVPLALVAGISSPDMQIFRVQDLELKLDESVVTGGAKLDLGSSVPAVQASIRSDELDLRPILPQSKADSGKKASGKEGDDSRKRVFPDTPLSGDFLRAVDAAVTTEIKRLLLPGMECENLRVDLALANGELRVDPLRLDMAGGSLTGEMGMRDLKQGMAVTSKMDITGMRLKELLAMAGHRDFLRGDLETHLDISASGESVAGLMGAMNGDTAVIIGEGKLDSAYLDKVGGDVFGTLRQYIDPEKKSEEYTKLNCMTAAFDLNQGVAASRVILVDTSRMHILSQGKVDLGTEKLDFGFNPSPKEGLDTGALGTISLSLSELSKPFKLSGTLADPSVALDVKGAALTAGKAIGGAAAGGPAGAAAALLAGSGGERMACSEAIAVARGEKEPPGERSAETQEQGAEQGQESEEGSGVEKELDRLKKGVQDLF